MKRETKVKSNIPFKLDDWNGLRKKDIFNLKWSKIYSFTSYDYSDSSLPWAGGVYCFLEEYEGLYYVIYVGQTKNIPDRMCHYWARRIRNKKLDECIHESETYFVFLRTDSPARRDKIESDLIKKYQPEHNTQKGVFNRKVVKRKKISEPSSTIAKTIENFLQKKPGIHSYVLSVGECFIIYLPEDFSPIEIAKWEQDTLVIPKIIGNFPRITRNIKKIISEANNRGIAIVNENTNEL